MQRVKIGSDVIRSRNQEWSASMFCIGTTTLHINYLPDYDMSECFSYTDGFKLVGTYAVALQIDAHRNTTWCRLSFMNLNLKKSPFLSLKGKKNINLHN